MLALLEIKDLMCCSNFSSVIEGIPNKLPVDEVDKTLESIVHGQEYIVYKKEFPFN